jgi:hypothetical protein
MGLALASAEAAVAAWRHAGRGAALGFQKRLATKMTRPFALANLIWRMGENRHTAGTMTGMASLFPALVRMMSQATRIEPR